MPEEKANSSGRPGPGPAVAKAAKSKRPFLRENGAVAVELTNGKSASQKFEEEAARWEETGEMQQSGSDEYAFTKLRCWIGSKGAEADGVSERLERYYAAAEARLEQELGPGWYDHFLRTRSWCSICGTGFRLENLGLCTHCDALIGYCHQFDGGFAANGNFKCPKCKDGETVG